jgi:uncharacterized protein YbaP (TraB family)
MMKSMRMLRAALLLLALVAPCRGRTDEPAMFAEVAGPHGFLYEVRAKKPAPDHADAPRLFLFGTIHVGDSSQTPFTHAVRAALADSRQLALEADPSDLGALARVLGPSVLYPKDDSLDRHIPAATLAALKKVMPKLRLDAARVMKMRLWLVPMAIGLAEGEKLGLSGSYGTEVYLAAWAKSHALPIVELEGAAAQLEIISSEPEAMQLEGLDNTLKDVESGDSVRKLQRIVKAWNDADTKSAEEIVRQAHQSKRRSEREFTRRLLDERNLKMAARADEFLRAGKATFLAVGTAHLFGDAGLIALMKKKGYTVTPVR